MPILNNGADSVYTPGFVLLINNKRSLRCFSIESQIVTKISRAAPAALSFSILYAYAMYFLAEIGCDNTFIRYVPAVGPIIWIALSMLYIKFIFNEKIMNKNKLNVVTVNEIGGWDVSFANPIDIHILSVSIIQIIMPIISIIATPCAFKIKFMSAIFITVMSICTIIMMLFFLFIVIGIANLYIESK